MSTNLKHEALLASPVFFPLNFKGPLGEFGAPGPSFPILFNLLPAPYLAEPLASLIRAFEHYILLMYLAVCLRSHSIHYNIFFYFSIYFTIFPPKNFDWLCLLLSEGRTRSHAWKLIIERSYLELGRNFLRVRASSAMEELAS